MPEENLKSKTIVSMLWTGTQRFGVLILSFVTNLVLAWYLDPEDFGTVGMISIFITLAENLTDSGLGAALIQKKDATDIDFSTVFWANLFISILIYVVLFFASPLIARFYKIDVLTKVLRIKAILIILQAFRIIHTTILQKQLSFKKISIIYLIAALVSTITSIVLAILGWGLWSLVVKSILDIFIRAVLFWIFCKWKPLFKFSFTSFKELFSFGSVMLFTTMFTTIYEEGQGLIIGKAFSATDLGYYTQGKKLQEVPTNALNQVVNQVTFPVFTKLKDDIEKMKKGFQKIILSISYIVFPMMIFFIISATPIFHFLYKTKWDFSIPYFRFLCIVGMMVCINTINTNLIKASGLKGLYFKLEIIKRIVGFVFIIASIYFGLYGLLIANIIIEYCFFIVNAIVTKRVINYSLWEQFKDLLPNYILSFVTGGIVFFIFSFLSLPNIIFIFLEFLIFSIIFISLSALFKFKSFEIYKEIIISKLNKKKNKNT